MTAILDGQDANAPGVLPAQDPVLGPKLTVDNVDGNHIVLNIGNGAYAFYAHLMKGSMRVKVGDKVTKGQVIAKLGNTGNANASHLHFQVMNGPQRRCRWSRQCPRLRPCWTDRPARRR